MEEIDQIALPVRLDAITGEADAHQCPQGRLDGLAALVEANPAKARLLALAVVLAGAESNTSKESWRRGDERAAAYLRQLAAWDTRCARSSRSSPATPPPPRPRAWPDAPVTPGVTPPHHPFSNPTASPSAAQEGAP